MDAEEHKIRKKVKIVDMPMGSGKTTGMMEYMRNHDDKKYVFITPFLSETKRISEGCPELDFRCPKDEFSKLSSFKRFATMKKNIASTHALLGMMDKSAIKTIRDGHYTLILDEVIGAIDVLDVKKRDIQMMINEKIIEIPEEGQIIFNKKNYELKGLKFSTDVTVINNEPTYLVNESCIVTTFNPEIFYCFDEIIVLTYIFEGSMMKYHFDLNGIEYEYCYIKEGNIIKGRYDDTGFRENAKQLINIYEGKLNLVGDKETSLSSSWFDPKKNKDEHARLKNNLYNYFRNIVKSNVNLAMWSTFNGGNEKIKKEFSPRSFQKGCFVACNARATNEFSHKRDLAYLINVYINPFVSQFIIKNTKSNINTEFYALSQMMQWIWRSRIRNGEPINIYIPSYRMRRILYEWLGVEYDKPRSRMIRKGKNKNE